MPVVVVGAGHSGLAASRVLTARGIDHVVLERGEVANTWRSERWDSLRLLTPNWMTALPGHAYGGDDPDGYMHVGELIEFLDDYAAQHPEPIHTHTEVQRIGVDDTERFIVDTNRGTWQARSVILASGPYNKPSVPALAADLPGEIDQITAYDYKRPDQLRQGRVLMVGSSATGLQLADELLDSGRDVTISVAEHVRLPRTYRGQDIMWWMGALGRLDERWDEIEDLVRARSVPSPQVVGRADGESLDLNTLTAKGAELVGQFMAVHDTNALFSGSLRNVCSLADLKANRLLGEADEWAAANGWDDTPGPRPDPTVVPDDPRTTIDLVAEDYHTVFWATGYKADYSWLDIDVLDHNGRIRHDGGVVTARPGLYRMGLNFLRRRRSSYIHGAEGDAEAIVEHLIGHLADQSVGAGTQG